MRCSALPIASKCRGSYQLTSGHGSAQSRVGSAFHEAARAKVQGVAFDVESLRTRYALTDTEMKNIDYGIYNLSVRIPEGAMVLADDRKLSGLGGRLEGTPDLGIYTNRVATVADWKSGWMDVEDPETNNQAMGYGVMFLEELEKQGLEVEKIQLMIIQPLLNQVKAFVFTPEQIHERAKDILRIIEEAESEAGAKEFTTGPWCASCFKNMHCPAFAGQVREFAELVETKEGEIVPAPMAISTERALRRLLPLAKACNTMSKRIEALAKAWVDANGPLDLGAGQLYVKVLEDENEIKTKPTFEILKEYFSEERIWESLSISMEKITDMAKEVKRGLSTIVKNRLIEAGAMKKKTVSKYRIKKGGDNGS